MFPCEIKELPTQFTLYIRFRAPVQDLPNHFQRIYSRIFGYLGQLGVQPAGAPFAAYHNMDMQDLHVEAGVPLLKPQPGQGEIHTGRIEGGLFAICHYTGAYGGVGPAYDDLTRFIEEKGFEMSGPVYEWYLNGPDVPQKDLKTDIVFPVTRITNEAMI